MAALLYGETMRKITDEHEEFQNEKGIDVYYNEFTNYFTIARSEDIIYEFYDGDTIDTAITQIVSTIQKY